MSAMPCNLRTTQRDWESPTIHLEVSPTRGNATNASQLATRCKSFCSFFARKSHPVHAQPANKQVIGRVTSLSPEGEGVVSSSWDGLSHPSLDDWGSPGILVVPPNEMSITIEDSWVVLDLAGKKADLIEMETTYSVLISHAGPLLHKLYCNSYQWKALHSLFHWCSLPIQAAVDLVCLSNWASVSYSCPWKEPSEFPQGHTPVRKPWAAL